MIAIHHAGRSYACADGGSQVAGIQSTHMAKNYSDIAYHFGIDCNGTLFEARDIRLKGGHLLNYNSGVIRIVLLEDLSSSDEANDVIAGARQFMERMGFNTQNRVPNAQRDSLVAVVDVLIDIFKISVLGGHREFPKQLGEGKICPGNIGLELVENLRIHFKLIAPPKK